MPHQTVLIVEDDRDIRELVRYNLEKEGYTVLTEPEGSNVLETVRSSKPDLVILDLMLPGKDGLSICREIRAESEVRNTAIIMVTAKSEDIDVVTGLEVGADDYITKPFSPRVLIARVRAVLRRDDAAGEDSLRTLGRGGIEIDGERHRVKAGGKVLDLTSTEFRVLEFLARRPGIVFSRYQIVDAVKGEDYPVTDRSVDVQIVGLRRKLGDFSDYIETVRGVGYRFKEVT